MDKEPVSREHEDSFQVELVQWLQKHGLFFFSVPNEAAGKGGNMKVMGKLKAMGLRRGAPDLVVCDFQRVVFLELKAEDGKQSLGQIFVESQLKSRALEYYVVKNILQIEDIFLDKV